jgi:hypothetical protein
MLGFQVLFSLTDILGGGLFRFEFSHLAAPPYNI